MQPESSTWFFDPRWRRRALEAKFMCEDELRTMASLDKEVTKWTATLYEWWWGWALDLPDDEIKERQEGAKNIFLQSPQLKSRKEAVAWVEKILEIAGEFADEFHEFHNTNNKPLDVGAMHRYVTRTLDGYE